MDTINRGIKIEEEVQAPKPRRTRLMLIGIDKYEHWDKLNHPVSDCQEFFQVLKQHYGFTEADLIPSGRKHLLDEEATAVSIFDELYNLARKDEYGNHYLSSEDNLIIYFSGHGHFDPTINLGYWVPVEAPLPERGSDLRKLISVREIVQSLSVYKAHHIVLIVDSCFPQAFARYEVDIIDGGHPNNPEEKPSRWVLTSGRLETVPDKSLFAEALRELLKNNIEHKLSIATLGEQVKSRVSETTSNKPWSASLTDSRHDGGEFFFYRHEHRVKENEIIRKLVINRDTPDMPNMYNLLRDDHGAGLGDFEFENFEDELTKQEQFAAELRDRHGLLFENSEAVKSKQKTVNQLRVGTMNYLKRINSGRFRHLRIESLLLTENKLPELASFEVKLLGEQTQLHNAVSALRGKQRPHAVILGEGGMGKTSALMNIWEHHLHIDSPTIPVFVALNEYNTLPENEQSDFILRSIALNCGLIDNLPDDWMNNLWDILRQPQIDSTPTLLILLDGFNEVTAERTPLLAELNMIAQEAHGVQMVITSRYAEIRTYHWAEKSEILELQPLPELVVSGYLQMLGIGAQSDNKLSQLLVNPMMLNIFAGSSQYAHTHATDPRFRFMPARSVGELLWNFTEALLVKSYEEHADSHCEQAWIRFLIRYVLPYIAYRMDVNGDFFIAYGRRANPQFNFKSLVDEAFLALDHPELMDVFPEFIGMQDKLCLGEAPSLEAAERRAMRVYEYLVEKLHLMVLEKEELRFLHQNFRDFFAANYLLILENIGNPMPAWTSR
jgi:hypothetical protein